MTVISAITMFLLFQAARPPLASQEALPVAVLVHRLNQVVVIESTLQLVLDLLDFCRVVCGEYDSTSKDHANHVNEGVRRDVHEFSEHRFTP